MYVPNGGGGHFSFKYILYIQVSSFSYMFFAVINIHKVEFKSVVINLREVKGEKKRKKEKK